MLLDWDPFMGTSSLTCTGSCGRGCLTQAHAQEEPLGGVPLPQVCPPPLWGGAASHAHTLGGSCSFLPRPSAPDTQFLLRPPDHPGVLGQGSAWSRVTK